MLWFPVVKVAKQGVNKLLEKMFENHNKEMIEMNKGFGMDDKKNKLYKCNHKKCGKIVILNKIRYCKGDNPVNFVFSIFNFEFSSSFFDSFSLPPIFSKFSYQSVFVFFFPVMTN